MYISFNVLSNTFITGLVFGDLAKIEPKVLTTASKPVKNEG